MTVTADLQLCRGHQLCQIEAPEAFEFDQDNNTVVVVYPYPEESVRASIKQAVSYCPTRALDFTEH